MTKGSNKAGMKLRRVLYRIGKYSMFVITVITCYNLTNHLLEIRREKIRKEKIRKNSLVFLTVLATAASIIVAFAGILKYIKLLKNFRQQNNATLLFRFMSRNLMLCLQKI